jgi:hypothetical protein
VVCDLVAFCVWGGGGSGEGLIGGKFGVEADEEVVVVEEIDGIGESGAGWEDGDVVEGGGCV